VAPGIVRLLKPQEHLPERQRVGKGWKFHARDRTCDRGMAMGIEFTGLDETTQKQLQRQVETIAVESAAITSGAEITDVWIRH